MKEGESGRGRAAKGEQHEVFPPQNQRVAGWEKSNKSATVTDLVADQTLLHTNTHTHTPVLMTGLTTAAGCGGVAVDNCFNAAIQFRCLHCYVRRPISQPPIIVSSRK